MPSFKLVERRDAAAVTLDGNHGGSGLKKRVCEATGAGADFVGGLAFERSGHCRNSGEQLAVQDEILTQRLAGLEPVPRDDFAQRLRW